VLAAIEQLGDERHALRDLRTLRGAAGRRVPGLPADGGAGRAAPPSLRRDDGGYGASVESYRKVHAGPWRPRYLGIHPHRAVVRGFYAIMRLSHVLGFAERS